MRNVLNLFTKIGSSILAICAVIIITIVIFAIAGASIIVIGGATIVIIPIFIVIFLLGLLFVFIDWIKRKLSRKTDDIVNTTIDDTSSI